MTSPWDVARRTPLGELQTRSSRCNLLAAADPADPRGLLLVCDPARRVVLLPV